MIFKQSDLWSCPLSGFRSILPLARACALCDHRDRNLYCEISFLALKLASAVDAHVAWGSNVDIPAFSAGFPWSGRRPGERSDRPLPCDRPAGNSALPEGRRA